MLSSNIQVYIPSWNTDFLIIFYLHEIKWNTVVLHPCQYFDTIGFISSCVVTTTTPPTKHPASSIIAHCSNPPSLYPRHSPSGCFWSVLKNSNLNLSIGNKFTITKLDTKLMIEKKVSQYFVYFLCGKESGNPVFL